MLEYTSDKQLSINSQLVAAADLGERLRTIYESRDDKTLFLIDPGAFGRVN